MLAFRVIKNIFAQLLIVALLVGCATDITRVSHSFQFDLRGDDQDARILDYKYLAGSKVQVSAPEEYVKKGTKFAFEGVTGPMLRGTSLYVRWVNTSSGTVYEDTVDLRRRLPIDIENKTIYLMIRGAQLYIYLISKEPRPQGKVAVGPSGYQHYNSSLIYPDKSGK